MELLKTSFITKTNYLSYEVESNTSKKSKKEEGSELIKAFEDWNC